MDEYPNIFGFDSKSLYLTINYIFYNYVYF